MLPEFCNGCARRINSTKCAGWSDPTGCKGQFWADKKQLEKETQERVEYIEKYHSKKSGAPTER